MNTPAAEGVHFALNSLRDWEPVEGLENRVGGGARAMGQYLGDCILVPGQHGDHQVHDEVVDTGLTQAWGQDHLAQRAQPELGVGLENLEIKKSGHKTIM